MQSGFILESLPQPEKALPATQQRDMRKDGLGFGIEAVT